MIYIVCYDLVDEKAKPPDYGELIEEIKKNYPRNDHLQYSVWLLDTNDTAREIRRRLREYVPADSHLFIGRLAEEWKAKGLQPNRKAWLESPNRNW